MLSQMSLVAPIALCAAISCAQPVSFIARAEATPDNKFRNTVMIFAFSLGVGFVLNVAIFIVVHCWCNGRASPDGSIGGNDTELMSANIDNTELMPANMHDTENLPYSESRQSSMYYSANLIADDNSSIHSVQQADNTNQEAIDIARNKAHAAMKYSYTALAAIVKYDAQIAINYHKCISSIHKKDYNNATACYNKLVPYVSKCEELLNRCIISGEEAKLAIDNMVKGGTSSNAAANSYISKYDDIVKLMKKM